jgi:hypothetical protein
MDQRLSLFMLEGGGGGGLEAASLLPQFIDKCIYFIYKKYCLMYPAVCMGGIE